MRIGLTFNLRRPQAPGGANGRPWLTEGGAADCFAAAGDDEEEFDSPETIQALAAALETLGHEVELLGDGEAALARLLAGPRPELVFNLAEGCGVGRCREARLPAVLEMLGIPYTGSDPLTLSVALDKECAKRLVRAAGVATPDWVLVDASSDAAPCSASAGEEELQARLRRLSFPVIVKPVCEGSSKGILAKSLVHDASELVDVLGRLQAVYRQPALVEEFIDGDELTVGLVGNRPPQVLGIMRVVPLEQGGPFVYSLEVKRDWQRRVRYECPAAISPRGSRAVAEAALASWRALGCRDLARIDFRLRDGVPYFLEANPLPGLSPDYSDLVLLGQSLGITYCGLISRIVDAALERTGLAAACGG